jgi:hypothetical protein
MIFQIESRCRRLFLPTPGLGLCLRKVTRLDTSVLAVQIHWPVLFVYGETMITDFIEDFMETDNFQLHLDDMYGEGAPPLGWDQKQKYTRDRIQLYYQVSHVMTAAFERQISQSERSLC